MAGKFMLTFLVAVFAAACAGKTEYYNRTTTPDCMAPSDRTTTPDRTTAAPDRMAPPDRATTAPDCTHPP